MRKDNKCNILFFNSAARDEFHGKFAIYENYKPKRFETCELTAQLFKNRIFKLIMNAGK